VRPIPHRHTFSPVAVARRPGLPSIISSDPGPLHPSAAHPLEGEDHAAKDFLKIGAGSAAGLAACGALSPLTTALAAPAVGLGRAHVGNPRPRTRAAVDAWEA